MPDIASSTATPSDRPDTTSRPGDALVEQSAVALRRLIGRKEISPVELLEACIDRIERINPFVNAVTATCFDRARTEARAAEQAVVDGTAPLGLLHGLPLGVKDLEPTEGLLTTWGSAIYRDHVPTQDIELVARLRRAGAIVAGKTNVPELGAGANSRNTVWGATGNPFNPNLNAGAPRAARRPRWRVTCCRCARGPIPGALCASPQPSAGWWVFGHRPAWCPACASRWGGPPSRWSAPWAARWKTPACNWPHRPACRRATR